MGLLNKVFATILLVCSVGAAIAKVNVQSFDSSIVINESYINFQAQNDIDSMMSLHPALSGNIPVTTEFFHLFAADTFDFYIVLSLLLAFGLMRFANPRYFNYLLRAFRSPSFSLQQLKDQIGTAVLPNILMNVFFALSTGIYLFFIFKLNMPQRYAIYSPSLIITALVSGLLVLYGAKYLVMRFSGWVFNARVVASHYMYNVFLINKVISITLLPFTIMLAFASPAISYPAMIVSFFLIAILLINRYMRSWQVLGPFFQYGKFHFFAYLCASEILPMALLTKLLIQGLYY